MGFSFMALYVGGMADRSTKIDQPLHRVTPDRSGTTCTIPFLSLLTGVVSYQPLHRVTPDRSGNTMLFLSLSTCEGLGTVRWYTLLLKGRVTRIICLLLSVNTCQCSTRD
jgi:hypothetical protein